MNSISYYLFFIFYLEEKNKIFRKEIYMKKSELVRIISNKTGITQKRVADVVDALFDTLTEVMVNGDRYSHEGFGSMSSRKAKARVARNPLTSEPINVPAHYTPKFTPSKILKEKIKNANKDK